MVKFVVKFVVKCVVKLKIDSGLSKHLPLKTFACVSLKYRKCHGKFLNKFYEIKILFVPLVIYWQVQILTSQSICSKCPKINSLLNFLHFFGIVGINETSQDYVSRLWPFFWMWWWPVQAAGTFALPPPSLVIMSTRPNKG